ncbi:hypothetical protein [Acidipila sp. EB88]|uniref:hypothetical protein n=1 Tax=Acidipila sp. EB88 TaxID=2305226 RepID=UPI000F5F3549|nr:hypothetical protein [Acidipila sp. EB88]RRA49869.1 hypothetical protein D1Y84_01535 [Acidipila sp. EB88]
MHLPDGGLTASSISMNRRGFLRSSFGMLSAASVRGALASFAPDALRPAQKTVIVTFGGGARDEETFAEEGQQNIPHLLQELLPQGTFFTQVVNAGILGHYVATASIVTGAYERFNNFIAQPPPNPTLFEYYRKALRRPATDTWVIAPSNGFQRIGGSSDSAFGPAFEAGVILPKRLLSAALKQGSGADTDRLSHLLQDNYEMPLYQSAAAAHDDELHLDRLDSTLRLSVADFLARARASDSADELSIFIARQLMRQQSPSLLLLTLHDMDIAHSGAYSLYVDAIQRADRLCAELWQMIQSDPEYKDRTTLYIMPDFGRDADDDPAGNGFQHHRTGGALARTTWLLALGPHIRQNVTVDRPIASIDLVPTVGCHMGFPTPLAQGRCIQELL